MARLEAVDSPGEASVVGFRGYKRALSDDLTGFVEDHQLVWCQVGGLAKNARVLSSEFTQGGGKSKGAFAGSTRNDERGNQHGSRVRIETALFCALQGVGSGDSKRDAGRVLVGTPCPSLEGCQDLSVYVSEDLS